MSNAEYKQVKTQLVYVLVDFVVQIDNEEICCESLRVVANLTRIKEFCNVVIEAKIHEALLILLESTSKEIVYYCLGVLSNLMADNNFRYSLKYAGKCSKNQLSVVSFPSSTIVITMISIW